MAKILVIDDEKDSRDTILMALGNAGYEMLGAEDGAKGLDLARRHRPDLILCDLLMPGLSGYETLAALRNDASTAKIPLVFLTGFSDPFSKVRGLELGVDDYLEKPFAVDQLLEVVRAALKKTGQNRGRQQSP